MTDEAFALFFLVFSEKLRKRAKHVQRKLDCMGLLAGSIFASTGQRKETVKLTADELRKCDTQDNTCEIHVSVNLISQ